MCRVVLTTNYGPRAVIHMVHSLTGAYSIW